MTNRLIVCATVALLASVSGCAYMGPAVPTATITTTTAAATPAGKQEAMIWTVDGKRVAARRASYRLPAGRHSVSVVPVQDGPRSTTLAYGASAMARGIEIAEIDVDLEPGQRLTLAAVTRHHRIYLTTNGVDEPLEPRRTTVLPYVIE